MTVYPHPVEFGGKSMLQINEEYQHETVQYRDSNNKSKRTKIRFFFRNYTIYLPNFSFILLTLFFLLELNIPPGQLKAVNINGTEIIWEFNTNGVIAFCLTNANPGGKCAISVPMLLVVNTSEITGTLFFYGLPS